MNAFAERYATLDATRSTLDRVHHMGPWSRGADPADAACAVYLLLGRRIKGCVRPPLQREVAAVMSGPPVCLVEEPCAVVGYPAETVPLPAPPVAESACCR